MGHVARDVFVTCPGDFLLSVCRCLSSKWLKVGMNQTRSCRGHVIAVDRKIDHLGICGCHSTKEISACQEGIAQKLGTKAFQRNKVVVRKEANGSIGIIWKDVGNHDSLSSLDPSVWDQIGRKSACLLIDRVFTEWAADFNRFLDDGVQVREIGLGDINGHDPSGCLS